jgi:hypothetical protein
VLFREGVIVSMKLSGNLYASNALPYTGRISEKMSSMVMGEIVLKMGVSSKGVGVVSNRAGMGA